MSHSSIVTDDSEDSLNLGAEKRSKTRIASDGRATQRLKADPRSGKSSEVLNSDTETEPIEEFPSQPRKRGGVVKDLVRSFERNDAPKLQLTSDNPLNLLPLANHKPKVGLHPSGELLTDMLAASRGLPPQSRSPRGL